MIWSFHRKIKFEYDPISSRDLDFTFLMIYLVKNQISRHPSGSGAPSRNYEVVFGVGWSFSVS